MYILILISISKENIAPPPTYTALSYLYKTQFHLQLLDDY